MESFFFFSQIQNLGYRVSNTNTAIEVTDKETQEIRKERCEVASGEGCAVVRVITSTRYIIFTTSETFFTDETVYNSLEAGQKETVVVTGWNLSIFPPRRIVELVDRK